MRITNTASIPHRLGNGQLIKPGGFASIPDGVWFGLMLNEITKAWLNSGALAAEPDGNAPEPDVEAALLSSDFIRAIRDGRERLVPLPNFTGGLPVDVGDGSGSIPLTDRLLDLAYVMRKTVVARGRTEAAIQAAMNRMVEGTTLIIPPGDTPITITNGLTAPNVDNITIDLSGNIFDASGLVHNPLQRSSGVAFKFQGAGLKGNSTLAANATKGDLSIQVVSAANYEVGHVLFMIAPVEDVLYDDVRKSCINVIVGIVGTTLYLLNPMRCSITAGTGVSARSYECQQGIKIIGGGTAVLRGGGQTHNPMANGNGQQGFLFTYCRGIEIDAMTVERFQGSSVYLETCADYIERKCTYRGRDYDAVIVENQNSSFYGLAGGRVVNAISDTCRYELTRHGPDLGYVDGFIQKNCTGVQTHRSFCGSHAPAWGVVVDNCVGIGCYQFVTYRAMDMIINGGRSVGNTNGVFSTDGVVSTVPAEERTLDWSGGSHTSASYGAALGTMLHRFDIDALSIESVLEPLRIHMDEIRDGNLNRFSGKALSDAAGTDIIEIGNGTANNKIKSLRVNNTKGENYTGNVISLRGSLDKSAPATGIWIKDTYGYGRADGVSGSVVSTINNGWFGDDVVIDGVYAMIDASAAVSIGSDVWRFRQMPTIENVKETTPTSRSNFTVGRAASATLGGAGNGTATRGAVIERTQPSAAANTAWMTDRNGTEGTLSGVTGHIASGSTTLTMTGNTESKVYPGCYIRIPGAGAAAGNLDTRVEAVSADNATATLATAASTTVTSGAPATLAYVALTYQAMSLMAGGASMTDMGNADLTATVGSTGGFIRANSALTAQRTITLSTTGAFTGAKFHIVRTASATGAFNLVVGSVATLAAEKQWCEVTYNGTAWVLTAYGTLP
jgi:hypothetical protein